MIRVSIKPTAPHPRRLNNNQRLGRYKELLLLIIHDHPTSIEKSRYGSLCTMFMTISYSSMIAPIKTKRDREYINEEVDPPAPI